MEKIANIIEHSGVADKTKGLIVNYGIFVKLPIVTYHHKVDAYVYFDCLCDYNNISIAPNGGTDWENAEIILSILLIGSEEINGFEIDGKKYEGRSSMEIEEIEKKSSELENEINAIVNEFYDVKLVKTKIDITPVLYKDTKNIPVLYKNTKNIVVIAPVIHITLQGFLGYQITKSIEQVVDNMRRND